MTNDILERLANRDPAAGTDDRPPEHLFERIVAEPRPAPAGRRPRRRLVTRRAGVIVSGLAIAVAALVGVAVSGHGGGLPDLAARAYAQTDSGDRVLHVVTELRQQFVGADPAPPSDNQITRIEKWTRGDEAHTVIHGDGGDDGKPESYDQLLGADGVIHNQISNGELQTQRESDGPEERKAVAFSRADFVGRFREGYEQGKLDHSGTTTFAGHDATRYIVNRSGSSGRTEYYLDAETGAPLGSIQVFKTDVPADAKGGPQAPRRVASEVRFTETVKTLERLPVNAQTLAHLRTRG